MMKTNITFLSVLILFIYPALLTADDYDEWKIKRQETYEFIKNPVVSRKGDTISVQFETKAFCDVTVAIENADGKIIRHLASGVLGNNAPEPFIKNEKAQTLIWDSKNDKGEYVKDKNDLIIRVSLGLKAQYEKNLFWEPKKRVSTGHSGGNNTEDVLPVATPEGVYVYDGNGVDHVRLFDHEGNYTKTIYPFPESKLKDVKGLEWQDYPQGFKRPKKYGLNQTSFLRSGGVNRYTFLQPSAYSMAIKGNNIALGRLSLSRLATDGSSGNLNIHGPKVYFNLSESTSPQPDYGVQYFHKELRCSPYSMAFSPDGKKLYMAGYSNFTGAVIQGGAKVWLGGIAVIDFDGELEAQVFTGDLKIHSGLTPGVATDEKGNIYVTDHINDQILIYDKDAKLIKSFASRKPTIININPKNGEIFVFSWYLGGLIWGANPELKKQAETCKEKPSLNIYKSLEEPKLLETYELPPTVNGAGARDLWGDTGGTIVRAAVDFWGESPTIWLVSGGSKNTNLTEKSIPFEFKGSSWSTSNLQLLQMKDNKLVAKREFGKDISNAIKRISVNYGHQKLYVNPNNEKLYVTEKETNVGGGEFRTLVEITPDTGAVKEIPIPLSSAEDMAFDIDGNIYLRQIKPQRVTRYSIDNPWREVPWDYGIEGKDNDGKFELLSTLPLPAWNTVCQSEGGMWVSSKGYLAVSCSVKPSGKSDLDKYIRKDIKLGSDTEIYTAPNYPGRIANSLNATVQVWDKHGKIVYEDAVPGMSQIDGLGIDKNDNIYVMSCTPRVIGGKNYFNTLTGTVVKVKPNKNKWISNDKNTCVIPLPAAEVPKRSPDISGFPMSDVWVEGAEWFYGGVGNCSFKFPGCVCWQQSRFTIDYFARSFAPEPDQFSVAVLDSNGNLIMKIGKYGNVDDGMPSASAIAISQKVGAPITGPTLVSPHPRSIGGDEVSLMHACHVATLSDRFLYIGDVGNSRIVQVKLGYNVEQKIEIRNIKDTNEK